MMILRYIGGYTIKTVETQCVTQSSSIRHRRFAFSFRELDAFRLINGILTIKMERIVGTPNFLT